MTDEVSFLDRRDNNLEKRGKADKKKVGGCPAFNLMPQFPEYPGGDTVLVNDAAIISRNSPLKNIKRWWLTTRDNQCLPVLRGHLDAATYIQDRTDPQKDGVASIDHIYEKSMLLDFFNAIIDPNGPAVKGMFTGGPRAKINCKDMEAYGGATKKSKKNLLQKVFDAYPGAVANPQDKIMFQNVQYFEDFIGMDQWTNGNAKVR
jgi:hypothetical protein